MGGCRRPVLLTNHQTYRMPRTNIIDIQSLFDSTIYTSIAQNEM